jgi:hypothetical protein
MKPPAPIRILNFCRHPDERRYRRGGILPPGNGAKRRQIQSDEGVKNSTPFLINRNIPIPAGSVGILPTSTLK